MNDFFHLLERKGTIHSKLQQSVLEKKLSKKVEYDWLMACLHGLKHLPSIDGWLRRLRFKKEDLLAETSGRMAWSATRSASPWACSAATARRTTKNCYSRWASYRGQTVATKLSKLFHSPWQHQLETLGKSATAPEVLATMQQLCTVWENQCDWAGSDALALFPPGSDP